MGSRTLCHFHMRKLKENKNKYSLLASKMNIVLISHSAGVLRHTISENAIANGICEGWILVLNSV